jgi:hypothetical protein
MQIMCLIKARDCFKTFFSMKCVYDKFHVTGPSLTSWWSFRFPCNPKLYMLPWSNKPVSGPYPVQLNTIHILQLTSLQAGRSRVRFPMVSLKFFIYIILPAAFGPGLDSASNRNEYQEYLLGGSGGRYVGLTILPPSCVDCLEIWEPQPPGTVRVCPDL